MLTMKFTQVKIERCKRCSVILTEEEKETSRSNTEALDSRDHCFACCSPVTHDAGDFVTFRAVKAPTNKEATDEWVSRVSMVLDESIWGTSTHKAKVDFYTFARELERTRI